MADACPFCSETPELEPGFSLANDHAFVRPDGFPVSKGHLLIIPKRHVRDWFDLFAEEQSAVMELVNQGKAWLDKQYRPDGYNIGMNCGEVAGQTIGHMHCHLIPRYRGDVDDPRGGVRWVIPRRARYWGNDESSGL